MNDSNLANEENIRGFATPPVLEGRSNFRRNSQKMRNGRSWMGYHYSRKSSSINRSQHPRNFSASEGGISEFDLDSVVENFDPNNEKYLCCCGHAHSVTGMRIVAAMLSVTVLFELWELVVTIFASGMQIDLMGPAARFFVGSMIVGSIVWAIVGEREELLIPYLLLQVFLAGLAVVLIFFVSLVFIALFGSNNLGFAILRSFRIPLKSEDSPYISYIAWLMVGSVAIVIFLHVWLMCLVISCWRYLRDKRNSQHYVQLVRYRPKKIELLTRMRISLSAEALNSAPFKKSTWFASRSFSASLEN